jgi:hypothetical protein
MRPKTFQPTRNLLGKGTIKALGAVQAEIRLESGETEWVDLRLVHTKHEVGTVGELWYHYEGNSGLIHFCSNGAL